MLSYKKCLRYLIPCLMVSLLMACAKDKVAPGTASLTIINAVPDSRPLVTNFNGGNPFDYYLAVQLDYKVPFNPLVNRFRSYSGSQPLWLYQYPDTTDKNTPLFKLTLDLPIGATRTLFLTGTVNTPDTVFTNDVLPYHPLGDSTTGLRFVNLSPGSAPVKVVIKNKTGDAEVSSLPFKGVTGFRNYPVNAALEDYVFEFRDAASNTLITSFTTNGIHYPLPGGVHQWVFRNWTLALVGLPGGTNGQEQTIMAFSY